MPTCPVCESTQILIVLSATRRGSCRDCGARWVQDGSVQRSVRPGTIPNVVAVHQAPAATPSVTP
jgi:transposase-like protein